MTELIRGKQLQTYVVGLSTSSGARFNTIQAAIDQAIADGANGSAPAEILIQPGSYAENLTLSGGGILLKGTQPDAGTAILGTIDITNDPTGISFYGIIGIFVSGLVTITGASTSSTGVAIDSSSLGTGIDASGSTAALGTGLTLKNSQIIRAGGNVVVTGSNTFVFIDRCLISTEDTNVAMSHGGALTATYTIFSGQVVQTATSSLHAYQYCYFETQGIDSLVLNNANTVEVVGCSFELDGAAAYAINKAGAGRLDQSGNNFYGPYLSPPVNVTAGTTQLGESLEGFVTEVDGVAIGQRPRINLVTGANVTLTGTDVPASDRVNVQIDATGGGSTSGESIDDKGLTPAGTTAGDQQPTGLTITNTPTPNGAATGLGYVTVVVNGVVVRTGGATTGAPCYFSNDGGVTARALDEIVAGDQLIWNQTVGAGGLGYNLDPNDSIDLLYESA